MRQVLDRLARYAGERPHDIAVAQVIPCARRAEWTWSRLHDAVRGIADHIRRRVQPGNVVMLISPNRPEFIAAYLGVMAADAVVFPVHPALTSPELREAARRSQSRMIIAGEVTRRLIDDEGLEWVDLDSITAMRSSKCSVARGELDLAAMLLQSSGTTGTPKIVHRSGGSLDAVAKNVCGATGLSERDSVLAAIPLGHSYGVENALLAPIIAGAAIQLMDGFDPAVAADQLTTAGITVFPGVPFMWQALMERSPQLSVPRLRLAYSAGGPLPRSVFEACAAGMNIRVGQLYGSTEVGSVTFNDPRQADHDPIAVGRAMHDVSILILDAQSLDIHRPLRTGDEGHVAIRSPSMLDRYIDEPVSAHHQGYFLTGDLGRLDEKSNLAITGRVKRQIDVGGFKVNPLEIEGVLCQHPAVRECVVVPMAMSATVDRLKAMVVLDDKAPAISPEELRQFARERLASHKVPRLIELREDLPRSPTGKILCEALRCE